MTARNLCLAATLVYSLAAIGAMAPGAAMAPGGGTAQAEPAQSTMITGILVNSDLGEGHYLLEARGNREITVARRENSRQRALRGRRRTPARGPTIAESVAESGGDTDGAGPVGIGILLRSRAAVRIVGIVLPERVIERRMAVEQVVDECRELPARE